MVCLSPCEVNYMVGFRIKEWGRYLDLQDIRGEKKKEELNDL